jgi:hypothetical protein
VPILKRYNFDGIDIETGLTGSGSITTLSTSQANHERIIDGVLAQMPSTFGLTMAPETAYVTGGSVTYGSIWGSYLPIIKKYVDNGRLWWHNILEPEIRTTEEASAGWRPAQDAGRYEDPRGVRIVAGYDARVRTLSIEDGDGLAGVSVDVVGPDERRMLFRRTATGLEPCGLWLSSNGLPKLVNSREDMFARRTPAWRAAGRRPVVTPWLRCSAGRTCVGAFSPLT